MGATVPVNRSERLTCADLRTDQAVIRVLHKRRGRQAQGIDHRELVQRDRWRLLFEDRQVMADDLWPSAKRAPSPSMSSASRTLGRSL